VDLIGRDAPLALLRSKLDQALAGRGGVITVSGEAGIGKSTLAEALAAEVEARGVGVVRGRAWELGEAPPYFPLWTCLGSLGIEPAAREGDAFALWERVLGALGRRTEPLFWLLEDLHAADLLTLDLVTFLAQPLRALPALLLVTCRDADPRRSDRVAARLTRIARDGVEVRLERLGADDTARLAARSAGRALTAEASRKLGELSAGNPLFVVECARAYAVQGAASSAWSVPSTVREVVRGRFDQLSERTREMLGAGAVLGREFNAALVARMLGALPAQVVEALLPALGAGIVSEPSPGSYVVSHVVVRDAIEDSLAPTERARLHGLALFALAQAGEGPETLALRARHALLSLPTGAAADEAVQLAERAVALLERQGAFDRAYAMKQHALESGLLAATSVDARLELAALATKAGKPTEAQRLCDDVLASPESDSAHRARAALIMGADLLAGMIRRDLVALLERSMRELGDDEPALRCRVRARLAAALQPAEDYAGPVAMAEQAIAEARALGDEALLRDVLYVGGSAFVDCAPIDERMAVASELLTRAEQAGDRPLALRGHLRLAVDQLESGALDAFESSIDRIVELGDEIGHPRHRWRCLLAASMRAIACGRIEESERCIVEAGQLTALTDDPSHQFSLFAHRSLRARLLHRDLELQSSAEELMTALAGIPFGNVIGAVLGASFATRAGDRERAAAELARLEPLRRFVERDMTFAGLTAEADAFAGSEERRRHTRALLEPLADRHFHGGHVAFVYEGPVERVLGLLDASLGERERGVSRLKRALACMTARHYAPWIAQIRFDLATVLGDGAEARALRADAAALAEELGMQGLVARARMSVLPPPAATPPAVTLEIVRDGELWRVRSAERSALVKDSRGMRWLARLAESPGEEIHVLVLASDEGTSLPESSAGEQLDARARRAYEERLSDLAEQIDEAESDADAGRLEKLRRERAMLEAELARAFGLGHRARQAGSAGERARVNVQRRIKDAIARVVEVDRELGRRLEKSVRTGTYCSFRP